MNPEFLQRYASLHLHDIGEYSDEAYTKFVTECSDFLTTIKEMDHGLWEEVMVMNKTKQSALMKTILDDNALKIMPNSTEKYLEEVHAFEEFIGCSLTEPLPIEARQELCQELNLTIEELEEFEQLDESFISVIKVPIIGTMNAIYGVFKTFKSAIKSTDDLLSDKKTSGVSNLIKILLMAISAIGMGTISDGIAFGTVSTYFWAALLVFSIYTMISNRNVVMSAVDLLRTMLFSIFKFLKTKFPNVQFSKRLNAIYVLERSQLQGCIKSCGLVDASETDRLHIIRLSLTDINARDTDPTAADAKRYLKADCIFNCCMRYMISMTAELYGALKACVKNTMGVELRVRGDAINELQTIKLDAACEPIRTELNNITSQFNDFLDLTYKGNSQEINRWRHALNVQVMGVINGQHSRPVSVKYASKTTISPIVFEF